jgi:D-cysteine desulfhydrase
MSSAHPADSAIFGHLWTTPEASALFTDEGRTQAWLQILAALAQAQADVGLIPAEAAKTIRAHADAELIDLDLVAKQTRETGHSTMGLITALRAVLPEDAREWVYYGATMLAALTYLRYGIEPHVVCYGRGEGEPQGNMRLHRWLGVDVRFTGEAERSSVDAGIAAVTGELRAAGRHPYPVPRGGATPLGALGYVRASLELAAQLAGLDEPPSGLWLATGSCGTQAGLMAGAAVTSASYQVVGVTVSRPAGEAAGRVRDLAAAAAALAGTGPDLPGMSTGLRPPDVRTGWIGPGYGAPSAAGRAAARLVAETEGVFLDPVFGAKAMAALIAGCRAGRVHGPQVFLVSGGAPTLFAGDELTGSKA